MNCKNCNDPLENNAHFCNKCGAKVIVNRITSALLFKDFFFNTFGIDTQFFRTIKEMLLHPDRVFNDYLLGVRKRYVNPFGFLAIGAAFSLIIYNFFIEDYMRMAQSINAEQIATLKEDAAIDLKEYENLNTQEYQAVKIKKQAANLNLKFVDGFARFSIKYFNFYCFLFLFILALLSKWTYLKPHNYGEHLIINAYIYGFLCFFSVFSFILALLIHPSIFNYGQLVYFIYYLFAFGKFYKYSFWKSIVKLLRFLVGLCIVLVILIIIGACIGAIYGYFS
ncbi:DUF3667 domain-containing protein [Polaribacter sp.]|nr:DUF3667 domain-containing protein [Polaribacter sp.]